MSSERTANKVPSLPREVTFLSPAIRSGDHVFCSGQIGSRPDGSMVEGPIGQRVNQIMDNLDAVLQAHGSGLENVLKFNLYITSYKDFDAINEAYMKRIPTPAPARSCIGVANLPRGTDIEVECIAIVAPRAKL